MGQRRVVDKTSERAPKTTKSVNRRTGNAVLDATKVRRGEVERAKRRVSENVKALASQHIIEGPVNKSVYNGLGGEQFDAGIARMRHLEAKEDASKQPMVKVIPIGGYGEMGIGKNMTAFEYKDEIVVIDMGLLFPGDDYPGINYIIPDVSYLEANKDKVKAVVITHGHLDHIGAFKHIIGKLDAPVYSSPLTIGMLKKNMEDSKSDYEPEYHPMDMDAHEQVQLCDNFSAELVRVNHSIPDAAAVVLRTPVGVMIHSGDWRFEHEPVDGKKFDIVRMSEIAAKEKVLVFLNESTNVEQDGTCTSCSEGVIKESIDDVLDKYPKSRAIVSCFSSQLHRIQNIVQSAAAHGRKVAFSGFSMVQNVEIALKTGILNLPKNTIMPMEELVKLPDHEVCIVCTGSQGELNATLNRAATGAHRYIKIKENDVVVFASNPIPGNEPHVVRTTDGLMREGSDVLRNGQTERYGVGPLHLTGHGKREDHIKLLDILRPTYYIPNHGEYHMLAHNAEMAERDAGIPRENIFVLDDGDIVEFYGDGTAQRTGRVPVGGVMYDDSDTEVSEIVLKDRIHMSTEGIFVVILTIQKATGRLMVSPDIISRGFIYLRDNEKLIESIRHYARQKTSRVYASHKVDIEAFKHDLKEDITRILYDQTKRTPIVIPVVNEIANIGREGGKSTDVSNKERSRKFAEQEVARIRSNNKRVAIAKRPQSSASFSKSGLSTKKSAKDDVQTATKPAISYRKTPNGAQPMPLPGDD